MVLLFPYVFTTSYSHRSCSPRPSRFVTVRFYLPATVYKNINIHDIIPDNYYNRQIGTILCINVSRSRTYITVLMFPPVIYHRTTMGLWRVSSKFLGPIMCFNLWSRHIILKPPSRTFQCRPLSTTTTALINLGVHAFRLFIMTYCRVKSPSLSINFIEFDKCPPPTTVLYYGLLQFPVSNYKLTYSALLVSKLTCRNDYVTKRNNSLRLLYTINHTICVVYKIKYRSEY